MPLDITPCLKSGLNFDSNVIIIITTMVEAGDLKCCTQLGLPSQVIKHISHLIGARVHKITLPKSTQPGHPSVGRLNDEYLLKGGDALRLGSKVRYGSCLVVRKTV